MNVTIIDTPNFENENIDVVVDFLKNELKYAHVFVISFENPICQAQLVIDDKVKFGLQMFGKIFGNQFWKHVILQVSNWKYSDDFVNCREGLNPQKTESMWSNKIRDILKSASNIPVSTAFCIGVDLRMNTTLCSKIATSILKGKKIGEPLQVRTVVMKTLQIATR